jgi:hypothetical protein
LTIVKGRAFIDVRRRSVGTVPARHYAGHPAPLSSRWRRIAVARDEQAPPDGTRKAARSSRAATYRLISSVEIVHVRGPDAAHLAEVQLEAIKEVLTWALSQRHTSTHDEDRAA